MPKKYITVELEIDFYSDEETGETQMTYDNMESVYPVHVDTHDLSKEDIIAVQTYLREDDDAYFDIGWELKGLLGKAVE